MAFGQSGFGSKEERMDPAGGLKAFAGAKGAPAPIRNSEEKQMRDAAIGSIADTSLKTVAGGTGSNLANLGAATKGLGQAIMGGGANMASGMAGSLGPQGVASLLPHAAASGGIGSAMAGVGSAMLPFAGPLALAALPFLFNEGTESVGGNTMETDDINEIANNYAMMTGGSSRVMPRPVMGGAPFMDRPADVDTAGGVQPFMSATPNLGKSSESQLLNKFYSPGMGYGLAGIGEGLFDSAYMRKAPPVVNQVPSMENVSGRDVSTEFPGVYTAPRAPVNVEMTTPSYREVNPWGYYGGIANKVLNPVGTIMNSIWGTPVANESNHAYYKGGTHKVAGIDPQKYARGDDDIQFEMDNWGYTDFSQPQYIPDVGGYEDWGIDSIFNQQNFGTQRDPDKDWSRTNTMGPQMANFYDGKPGGWTKWHQNKADELFRIYDETGRPDVLRDLQELSRESRLYQGWHLPGVPLKYNSGTSAVGANPFQNSISAGKSAMRDMKAREVNAMLNNLQRQPRVPLSSPRTLSKTLFRGGPLGAAISTAMTPTMAADATWSDAEWSGMMGGNKAMSDREMKQQLHSQKMRQNEEAHRAKMMAQ